MKLGSSLRAALFAAKQSLLFVLSTALIMCGRDSVPLKSDTTLERHEFPAEIGFKWSYEVIASISGPQRDTVLIDTANVEIIDSALIMPDSVMGLFWMYNWAGGPSTYLFTWDIGDSLFTYSDPQFMYALGYVPVLPFPLESGDQWPGAPLRQSTYSVQVLGVDSVDMAESGLGFQEAFHIVGGRPDPKDTVETWLVPNIGIARFRWIKRDWVLGQRVVENWNLLSIDLNLNMSGSSYGRDLGAAALEQYTETKCVWVGLE